MKKSHRKKLLIFLGWLPLFLASIGILLYGSGKFIRVVSKSKPKSNYYTKYNTSSDVSIVGNLVFADGIGRQSILLMDTLKNEVSMNFISVSKNTLLDIPKYLLKCVNESRMDHGKVTIYEMPLHDEVTLSRFFPSSLIKIAYSMFESSRIPQRWVHLLNTKFHAVVVPDEFLVPIYKESGVTIPIFVIPLGIYLNEFLEKPTKEKRNDIFTFGNLSAISDRKNIEKLIEAFSMAFGNRKDVRLVLNSRFCNPQYDPMPTKKKIEQLGLKNVELSWKNLSWEEYIEKMASFDCYVNPARGEGFSIQPRESLALGIPTVLTNNTAQETLCKSGFVKEVPSKIIVPAYIPEMKDTCGNMFDCTVEDLASVLLEVYENYEKELIKAKQGREWVKQYRFENLKQKYLSLVKPNRVELGTEDKIENTYLMTTSEELYEKYLFLMNTY